MKKVIHIEDHAEWQQCVRNALMLNTDIEPVTSFGSMEEFRAASYPRADLYVCDRHIPERKGEHPNDETWKYLLETLSCLHSSSPVILFSSHPPKNYHRFVVEKIKKPAKVEDFDYFSFRETIERYLGLNGGMTR